MFSCRSYSWAVSTNEIAIVTDKVTVNSRKSRPSDLVQYLGRLPELRPHYAPWGVSQTFHLVRALSGFIVLPAAESGDKLTRFGPFSSQCRAGNVKIRRGDWNEELFRVLEGFPDLAHDDEVDACSDGAHVPAGQFAPPWRH